MLGSCSRRGTLLKDDIYLSL